MKIKGWFIYCAIVLAVFGVPFLLIPKPALSLFAVTLTEAEAIMMVRVFGAALIGLALIAWMTRNEPSSKARQAIVLGQCVESAIAFVVLLAGKLSGIGSALGWLPVLIHLSMALGFGYFLLKKSN
ncbi:MAG: hypothetical protein ONB32_13320 [candidate division KSB1 bacterium]|nr:hypothetical protein [candidate division KSB1 bacterium]MDZ7399688.1 hypothetical protein [candidate division KSB1 bacterium]